MISLLKSAGHYPKINPRHGDQVLRGDILIFCDNGRLTIRFSTYYIATHKMNNG